LQIVSNPKRIKPPSNLELDASNQIKPNQGGYATGHQTGQGRSSPHAKAWTPCSVQRIPAYSNVFAGVTGGPSNVFQLIPGYSSLFQHKKNFLGNQEVCDSGGESKEIVANRA